MTQDIRHSFPYLDLDLVEGLSIVHTNDATDHLWDNDHVAKVSPHRLRLLTSWCLTLLHYPGTEIQNIEDHLVTSHEKN